MAPSRARIPTRCLLYAEQRSVGREPREAPCKHCTARKTVDVAQSTTADASCGFKVLSIVKHQSFIRQLETAVGCFGAPSRGVWCAASARVSKPGFHVAGVGGKARPGYPLPAYPLAGSPPAAYPLPTYPKNSVLPPYPTPRLSPKSCTVCESVITHLHSVARHMQYCELCL